MYILVVHDPLDKYDKEYHFQECPSLPSIMMELWSRKLRLINFFYELPEDYFYNIY